MLNPITVTIVISTLITCGLWKLLDYQDKKNYPYGEYELTYRVYYTHSDVKEYVVTHNRPIAVRSFDGSNEVYLYNKGTVIETSAPIEVIRYVNKAK